MWAGITNSSINQRRTCMAQGRAESVFFPCLTSLNKFSSSFLHMGVSMHLRLAGKVKVSGKQSTIQGPPFLRQRGKTWYARSCSHWAAKPSKWSLVSHGLRERSGSFYQVKEWVSTGCEPKYTLFVEKHFLINQPVFDRVFTETTDSRG